MPQPKNLCLIRLSSLGDVCHAVALVQGIQQQWPDLSITWVIGKVEARLLEGLPGVEFIVLDKALGWRGYTNLRRQLRGRHFDILLHMHVSLRASLASLCVSTGTRVGFDRARAREYQWLFSNQKIRAIHGQHVVDGFLEFGRAIGVDIEIPSWHMPIPATATDWATQQLPTDRPILAIAPCASKDERNWTVAGYAAVARYAIEKYGMTVVLCGGNSAIETQYAQDISNQCPQPLLNLVGQTSLKQLLAVLQHATLLLAPDTGPAHMATAVGTPVIGLYAHSNPARTGPYRDQRYVISLYEKDLLDRYGKTPAQLPWGFRLKDAHAMHRINPQTVIKMFDTVMRDMGICAKS